MGVYHAEKCSTQRNAYANRMSLIALAMTDASAVA